MTQGSMTLSRADGQVQTVRILAMPLLGALVVFGIAFHTEATAAFGTWIDSTAYNHCFFVLPIALWLAWERRAAGAGMAPRPTLWPMLAMLPLGVVWLTAERLGIMEGRQLAAIFMFQTLLVALLGWRLARVYAGPIAYLVFLVPFGEFVTHSLQVFTAQFVDVGLAVLGIPHVVTEFLIEIPGGRFFVAEACAGLRFLIAAIAFGGLYVLLLYRSPLRRILFMLACLTVPVIANGFRALGIVVLGYLLGSAQAAAADHVIYGWGFFSAVILLLTAAGLPFRQDSPRTRPNLPTAGAERIGWAPVTLVAVAVALGAVTAPAAAAYLERTADTPVPLLPRFAAVPPCVADEARPAMVQTFRCGAFRLSATQEILSSRASGLQLKQALRPVGRGETSDVTYGRLRVPGHPPRDWRLAETERLPIMVASLLLDHKGLALAEGLTSRLARAWESLIAPPTTLILTKLTVEPARAAASAGAESDGAAPLQGARPVLMTFLSGQAGDIGSPAASGTAR